MTHDLVFLGNLIVDDVVFADGRTRMNEPGGAMLYATLGAALWGIRVGVVAPVGDDYPKPTLAALAQRGIDLSGLRPLGRTGLRNWLLYERHGRRILHELGCASHVEASPAPRDLERAPLARAYHVSPMPLECQARLIEPLAAHEGATLSLDPHEMLSAGTLDRWRPLLPLLDLLFVSREEIDLPDIDRDPAAALLPLASGKLKAFALKRGERGGTYVQVNTHRAIEWPARTSEVVDPTGAGDAFAGGYLAGRLQACGLAESLARGVVSASFAIETWGAAGLLGATREQALERLDDWRDAFSE